MQNAALALPAMALILSIETTTKVCSVALHLAGKLVATQELWIEKSHADSLMLMIEQLLSRSPYNKNALSAIAVSQGPGSYTGLRIGTSTAQGLCYALEVPLIAVNTLEAMAYGVNQYNVTNALLCPMIDARRMEVYYLLSDKKQHILEATHSKVIDKDSFQNWLNAYTILFFGDGAAKCQPILEKNKNAIFLSHIYPSATHIGVLAYEQFCQKKFEDSAYFEPLYLKEFQTKLPKKK